MSTAPSSDTPHRRLTFANMRVTDLPRSIAFFRALGFDFDARFTNDKGACMVMSDTSYAMLLVDDFFRGFTKKQPCDTATHAELLMAFSCGSRAEVDAVHDKPSQPGRRPRCPRRTWASCTSRPSTTSTGTTGRCSSWTARPYPPRGRRRPTPRGVSFVD